MAEAQGNTPATVSSKPCRTCGETKPLSDFPPRKQGTLDGCRHKCKACTRAYGRAWGKANREKKRGYARKWVAANPDKVAAKTKRCRARHPERYRQRAAKWYAENADWRRQKTRDWRANNPDGRAAQADARRARQHAAPAGDRKASIAYRKWVRETESIPCYWCQKPTKRKHRHIDHIVPLARGGSDSVANLCVACPHCNQKKHAKLPEEFAGQSELRLA